MTLPVGLALRLGSRALLGPCPGPKEKKKREEEKKRRTPLL